MHPAWLWFAREPRPILKGDGYPGSASGNRPETAKCPGPLCTHRVLPCASRRTPPCGRALPRRHRSYGPMRQTTRLRPTSFSLYGRSSQVAASPCCRMAFPDVISATCAWALGPLPRSAPPVLARFFPVDNGLAFRRHRLGAPEIPPKCSFAGGGGFRGCSHSLMFRLPCSLGPQAAPTTAACHGAAGPFTPRRTHAVTWHK